MSNFHEKLRSQLASKLVEIEPILTTDYVLTLVARNKSNPNAHIIVTAEKQIKDVLETIEELYPF